MRAVGGCGIHLTSTERSTMPPDLRKLFIRFIELGALLPHEDDFNDPEAVALVLREMQQVHDEMKKFPGMARVIAAIEEKFGPELMSGFDAPLRTTAPMPTFAMLARLPSTILPWICKMSFCALATI